MFRDRPTAHTGTTPSAWFQALFCNYSGGCRELPWPQPVTSGVLHICAGRPVNYSDSYVNQALTVQRWGAPEVTLFF